MDYPILSCQNRANQRMRIYTTGPDPGKIGARDEAGNYRWGWTMIDEPCGMGSTGTLPSLMAWFTACCC